MKKNQLSDEFITHIVDWNSGKLNNEQLDKLLEIFKNELKKYFFSRIEESNLIRIINSIIDKGSLLSDCIKHPHHCEVICAIACCSNYLSDILVRNPELLYQLYNESYLRADINTDEINSEIHRSFKIFKKIDSRIKFLKKIKRRYFLKIGLNDILGKNELIDTTRSLSLLAYAINSNLFDLSYKTVLEAHGIKSTKRKYCLLALGKLGGNELNYSSDIDLLVIHDKNSLVGASKKIYYSDIMTETIKLFVSNSTEFTDLGNLYRVDFRLRPDGNISPLSRSLPETINYYESRGEQWEKQMLIKLNFVVGDVNLFNQFQSFVHSYVFKMSSLNSPLEAIAKMKNNIEEMHWDSSNVKTTVGGIRDIEFIVQGLQLIHGKIIPGLRNGNSLECIEILYNNDLLSQSEYNTLKGAYIFYRRIEHFLQLMNNTQTHSLPDDANQLMQLSMYFGFGSSAQFKSTLGKHQQEVRKIFNSVINLEGENETGKNVLDEIRFADNKRARKNIEFLEFGTGLVAVKSFDAKTTDRFNALKPTLAEYLSNSHLPDKVIENFVKVVNGYKLPSIFYNELSDKFLFKQFLRIIEYSALAMNLIVEHPALIENLLSKKMFYKDYDSVTAGSNFRELMFILSCQYTLGLIDEAKVSEWLSVFIESKIRSTFNHLETGDNVFVAGLGSFALHDVNFKSDIDLIVVAADVEKQKGSDEVFQQFINDLQKKLFPIEIDFRLRPEGKSSPLVWDAQNYAKYLNNRAGIWEFQSLIKSNFICGDKKLFNRFTSIVFNALKKKPEKDIKFAVAEMHSKSTQQKFGSLGSSIDIKNSAGSFMTLDYLLTLKLLAAAGKREMFVGGRKKIKLMKSVFETTEHILNGYLFLKKILFGLQIVANWNKAKLPTDNSILTELCSFIGVESVDQLQRKLRGIFLENQKLFTKNLENFG